MEESIKNMKAFLKTQQEEMAAKAAEDAEKASLGDNLFTRKERSSQEKREFAAFMSGTTF